MLNRDFPTSAHRAFEEQDDDGDRPPRRHRIRRAVAVAVAALLVTGLILAWAILGAR
ncbi:MAG TPA: hypothetical protein VK646_02360 [Actinomycetota bacterium]|nr:hypothetical protein [Actinomycetota bacterium]